MSIFVVNVEKAFLRSDPVKAVGNELAVLSENTQVTEVGQKVGIWRHVTCALAGTTFTGFVSERVLIPAAAANVPTLSGPAVPAVHYKEGNPAVRRAAKAGASPMGEAGMPKRRREDGASNAPLIDFINWAQVDNVAHVRWKPAGVTYCNIYAYDYCYAAGVFLPRVWWKPDAIKKLEAGQSVAVAYGQSVREMNANSLHDWLLDHGAAYGWKRATSPDQLQNAANAGAVAVICAARTNAAKSGHITVVVAEHATRGAARANGKVTLPLQSQAGAKNVRHGTIGKPWWQGAQFRSFVFYYNEALSSWV